MKTQEKYEILRAVSKLLDAEYSSASIDSDYIQITTEPRRSRPINIGKDVTITIKGRVMF